MQIHQAYRFELDPNQAQIILLKKSVGTARYAWNWALAKRLELMQLYPDVKDKRRYLNAIELHKLWVKFKQEQPWIYEVSKCVGQEAFVHLDKAFKLFYKSKREGKKIGFPKFKNKGKCRDAFKEDSHVRYSSKYAILPRIGSVRIKEKHPKIKGKILSATVSRTADRWFISYCVTRDIPEPIQPNGSVVGIDLGLKTFATINDGISTKFIVAPKPLVNSLRKLKRLSKSHSRKKKGSANRKKAQLKLSKHHAKIANIRNDFLHKITTELAKTKQAIVVEDLNVSGLSRTNLAKHILDAGWSAFRRMLSYKSNWYGSKLIIADRFFASSKICSQCGNKKTDLTLADRIYHCRVCNLTIDRDENAAINLRKFGLNEMSSTTASSAVSKACGSVSSDRYRKKSMKLTDMKQEAFVELSKACE